MKKKSASRSRSGSRVAKSPELQKSLGDMKSYKILTSIV